MSIPEPDTAMTQPGPRPAPGALQAMWATDRTMAGLAEPYRARPAPLRSPNHLTSVTGITPNRV